MEVDKMKRRKLLTSVLAGSILLGGLAGCAQNSPSKNNRSDVKYEPEVNYAAVKEGTYQSFDEKKAVEAYNGYAMNLFSKVASGGGKSNIMVSPASVMFALDLADAGADHDGILSLQLSPVKGHPCTFFRADLRHILLQSGDFLLHRPDDADGPDSSLAHCIFPFSLL